MRIKRLYKSKDVEMFDAIHYCYHVFGENLADFTAHDPSLNSSYLDNWKLALDEMVLLLPNKNKESAVREDISLIKDATKSLKDCRAKYRQVKYYAGKAFPNNKEILKEFGEGTYSKVQFSRLRMVQFMQTLHGVAEKYKTELIAADYSQTAIDEIATLTNALRTDNNLQQLKKKERPTETRKRIEALNRYYSFGQRVAEAAQIVFRDNEVLRKSFLLAKRHHPKMTKSWLVIAPSAARKINVTKLLKKFNVTLTNQSKENIEYWRAENIHEEPFHKFQLAAGETIELNPEVPIRKFLVLKNTSPKEVRVMMTKKERNNSERKLSS